MSRGLVTPRVVGASLVGVVAGWLLARRWSEAHRDALFAPQLHLRHAALGWLESEGDPATVGLLQDYAAWERVPALRARARRLAASLAGAA